MSNRKRKCIFCGTYSRQHNGIVMPVGFFCKMQCVHGYAIKQGQKRTRKEKLRLEKKKREDFKKLKEKHKDKTWHLRNAQRLVNQYVNLRDHGKECISCGADFGTHKRNASHYRSVGACPSLRFNLWNIHSSCVQCNQSKSGNAIEYRIAIVKKYGEERVNWLESQNELPGYTVEYLKRLTTVFRKMIKRQKKRLTAYNQ